MFYLAYTHSCIYTPGQQWECWDPRGKWRIWPVSLIRNTLNETKKKYNKEILQQPWSWDCPCASLIQGSEDWDHRRDNLVSLTSKSRGSSRCCFMQPDWKASTNYALYPTQSPHGHMHPSVAALQRVWPSQGPLSVTHLLLRSHWPLAINSDSVSQSGKGDKERKWNRAT